MKIKFLNLLTKIIIVFYGFTILFYLITIAALIIVGKKNFEKISSFITPIQINGDEELSAKLYTKTVDYYLITSIFYCLYIHEFILGIKLWIKKFPRKLLEQFFMI